MENTNIIDITPIIQAVITLIISILSIIVFPRIKTWLNNNLTSEQIDIVKIIVQSAVQAAEQIYANSEKSGSSKKKFVLEYAKNKLAEIGFTISDSEIEIYLEQAVLELNSDK